MHKKISGLHLNVFIYHIVIGSNWLSYFQHTHSSSGQCVQHRAIRSTPQSSRYTWHNVTCPSYELEGRGPIVPPNRCKHAACLHDNHIYIYGGRNGGVCHGDMWRYNLAEKTWEQLSCHGDVPLSPQEHTMLAYKVIINIRYNNSCEPGE